MTTLVALLAEQSAELKYKGSNPFLVPSDRSTSTVRHCNQRNKAKMEAGSSAAERSVPEPIEYYKVVIGDSAHNEQVPPYYAIQSGTVDLPPPPYEVFQNPQQQTFESSSRTSGNHANNASKKSKSLVGCMGMRINAVKADHRLACCGCFACCFLLVLTLIFVSVFIILPQKASTPLAS